MPNVEARGEECVGGDGTVELNGSPMLLLRG